jgi:uridine kinase
MPVIAIGGGSGSGKTTFAQRLISRIGGDRCLLLSLDRFYADHPELEFEQRCQLNYDHPESMDAPLLGQCVNALAKGKPFQAPRYDFTVHRRFPDSELLNGSEILIVEGIFALYFTEIIAHADLKIYVDVDDDLQFARRLMRDMSERNRTAQSVYKQYVSTVKPMYQRYISPTRAQADFIVHTHGECQYNKVLDVLAAWLGEIK